MADTPTGHISQMALVETIKDPGNGQLRSVTNSLQLTPMVGWGGYTDVDFGAAEIEEVTTPYSDRSGTFNETQFHRDSAVAISMVLVDDWFPGIGADAWDTKYNRSSYWVQRLGYWTGAKRRCQLFWKYNGRSDTYWMNMVGNGMPNAIAMSERSIRNIQMNFKNPDGVIYRFNDTYDTTGVATTVTKDGRSLKTLKFGGSEVGGFTLPLTFPFTFTSGGVANAETNIINYMGTTENGFVARIYAGVSSATYNPRINVTNLSTGVVESIGFKGVSTGPTSAAVIPARTVGTTAQFVEIDTNKRTVLMNGNPNSRQNNYLSTPLNWPTLKPGLNQLTFTTNAQPNGSASANPPSDSYIEVSWFEAYLT